MDHSDSVPGDHWVQRERSVQLAELCVHGQTAKDLDFNTECCEVWDPLLEANPFCAMRSVSSSGALMSASASQKPNASSMLDVSAATTAVLPSLFTLIWRRFFCLGVRKNNACNPKGRPGQAAHNETV